MYYTNSQLKTVLEGWYNDNIGNNNYSKYVVTGNYYCEQVKVKRTASWTSGSATMTLYTSYTSNFKCTTDKNGKGLVNSSVGLLGLDLV